MTNYEIVITEEPNAPSLLQQKMDALFTSQSRQPFRRKIMALQLLIGGSVQGAAQVTMNFDYLLVDNIWVDESLQKQGYGIRLYQAIEDLAKQHGCQKILLQTYDFLNTLSFWERFGFRQVGNVPNCPAGHTLYYLAKDLP